MRYKTKINSLAPDMLKDLIYQENCYLGISINNPFFLGDYLGLLLQWIAKRFPTCKIIVGDHLHRINEYILNGVDDEALAIAEGKKRGKIIADRIEALLDEFPRKKFELEFWETYYNNPECQDQKRKLRESFETNKYFSRSVQESASDFIERQVSRGCHIHLDKASAVEKSVEYLLEEMAVFSYLIEKGYRVQVYPGTQLSILKEFANGEFTELGSNLNKGIFIDLTVKKVK
jgi:tRNA-dependent cyclodipeptide synthase